MPITAYTTFLGFVVMLGSYFVVSRRLSSDPGAGSVQVLHLRSFFLFMGLFCLLLSLPALLLVGDPDRFPIVMAWGYVIGHIFFYIAVTYIARLSFSIVPRLVSKDRFVLYAGVFVTVAVTIINIITMPFGKLPAYDAAHQLIELNAAPIVGISIALYAALTVFPTAVLMIVNGVRNPNARVRSFLLGGGLLILMVAGPMHDTARTAALYATADIVSAVSLLTIASGVLYKFNERTAWEASGRTVASR